MKIIVVLTLGLLFTACKTVKFDKTCDAYWSGNPNHKPGK